MVKALTDTDWQKLCRIFTQKVRTEIWGYSSDEHLENEDLISEKICRNSSCPGYPACPDHLEKPRFGNLLKVKRKHWFRTYRKFGNVPYSFCFWILFCKSKSKIFRVGKITEDQLKDYAEKKCGIEFAKNGYP